MFDWLPLTPAFLTGLALFSAATFIGTLVLIPWMITQIPDDYFTGEHRGKSLLAVQHPLLRLAWLLLKNCIGYLFILLGVVLLFLPGQGLLTILIGIVLIDFPMKFRLERRIVERRNILKIINWLRECAGKRPLVLHKD